MFYQEIAKSAKKENIDFIAIVKTPWHTFGLYSALKSIVQKESKKLFGYILIENASENGKNLEIERYISKIDFVDFKIIYSNGEKWEPSRKEHIKQFLEVKNEFFAIKKRNSKTIYCISPFQPAYWLATEISKCFNNPKLTYYIIDEGLGIYIRNRRTWANEFYYSCHSILKTAKYLLILHIDSIINKRLKKNNLLIDFSLLQNKKPNEKIAKDYTNAFLKFNDSNENYDRYSNSVIIIGQLYHENNQIKNDADLKVFAKIIDFYNKDNINVIIKPHPRDKNISRYKPLNCQIEQNSVVPIELILSGLKTPPRAIVGFTSTSLVSAKIFGKTDAISLNKIINNGDIKPSLKREFKAFNKTFDEIISIPNSVNEI